MTSSAPSTTSVILWLGIAAIVGGILLGLAFIAGPSGLNDLLNWVSGLAALLAGGTGTAALIKTRKIGGTVDTIREQTNGVLDKRIEDGVRRALSGRRSSDTAGHEPGDSL